MKHHDAGALLGNLPLLAKILLNLIGEDKTVHGQSSEDRTDIKEQKRIGKHLYQHRDCHRQQGDKKAQIDLAGQEPSPPDRSRVIEQHDRDCRQQHKRVPGPPLILSVRCDEEKSVVEEAAYDQKKIDGPQPEHSLKEPAFPHVFSAAVQQQNRQHRQRQRQEQAFRDNHEANRRARGGIETQDNISQHSTVVQNKNDKKAPEEALVPAIDPGHDGGEPQPQHAQQQRRPDDEIVEKIVPAVHSSAPPVQNG